MTNNYHDGHRQRLRQKFVQSNETCILSDHELIELLLFYSIPRINTNEIAHRLMDEFGSIQGIITAEPQKLTRIDGIGDNSAILLSLIGTIAKLSSIDDNTRERRLTSLSSTGKYCVGCFKKCCGERLCALYVDHTMKLIGETIFECGSQHEVPASVNKIVREAILKNASGVILTHNHFSEDAFCSVHDRNLTNVIEASLAAVNIVLIEHIIVHGDEYMPTMQFRTVSATRRALIEPFGSEFLNKFYKS